MEHLDLRGPDVPPSAVQFRKPDELSAVEAERQLVSQEAVDELVEAQGGYDKLYGQSIDRPPLRKSNAADLETKCRDSESGRE